MKDFYELDGLNLPESLTVKECAILLDIAELTIQRLVVSGVLKATQDDHILCSTLVDYLIQNEAANLPIEEAPMFDENGKRVGRVENEEKEEIVIHMDELFSDEDDYDPWPA
ncbi:MAG: hypothetical protein HQ557_17610 [Bacteroidetes bacterium]|nr:hypothetical protein [Bacteroidota bacterium]